MLILPGFTAREILHHGHETVLQRATRDADGEEVALKFSARPAPTARDRARLRYELELLREIEAPGIVRALSLETSNLGLVLVLELLKGKPLDAYIGASQIAVRTALDLAIGITRVVATVHQRRVVHKDLKPHHFVYDAANGQISLVDFGIATRMGHVARDAETGGLEGTLAYISPEQTGRINLGIDTRSDLYSLGVVFYELFTATLPFSSIDPMELLYSQVARKPLSPRSRDPRIPEAISEMILKLLSKAPEERYQSANGLLGDLKECARILERGDSIPDDWKIGTRDYPEELQLSHKLYGRDPERNRLLGLFEDVRAGNSALFLISGYSGVGKTALVAEVRKSLMKDGGFFASGKFDQLNRNMPYSSVAHALRELLGQILTRDATAVDFWRQRLKGALGPSASTLSMVVPELHALLGPLPEAPALGPAESQNRFDIAIDAFIRAFGQSGKPLVLFLDDLQWADQASLRLLHVLFGQGAPRGLLIVGAYRDNEVDASHPLRLTLAALRRDDAPVHEIQLQPLVGKDLQALLVDTLSLFADDVSPLAEAVFAKTRGNPFFAGQFIKSLHRDGLLRFSAENIRWEWDLAEIERRAVTDNVVDFMAGRLGLLDRKTQRTLELAACIGHEFDLHTLAIICEEPAEAVLQSLNPALCEGLIQALQSDHRYAAHLEESEQNASKVAYHFVHDRVHEATYALIDERQRASMRLRIGRLLLSRFDPANDDESLVFPIVNHFNQGRALLTDPEERRAIADLNRRAGERARKGAAFSAASEHYRMGLELLDDDTDLSLRLSLMLGFAESESLCGRFEAAEQYFERIDALAPTVLARAEAICLRLKLYQVAGLYREGVGLAERILRALGIVVPGSAEEANAAIGNEVAQISKNLAGRPIEALIDAKLVEDPTIRVSIEVLANAAPCAYIGQPAAFPFIALKMLNLSLEHGNTPASCFAYSVYGFMLVAVFGDTDAGYRFSEMSIRLNEKLDDISLRGTLLHLHGDHINFWKKDIRTDLPILEQAFIACQQAGDYVYANYLAFETIWQVYEISDPLEDVLRESDRFARFSRKTRNEAVFETIRLEQQFFRALMGNTEKPLQLAGADFDEQKSRRIIADANFGCGIAFGHVIDLILAYYRGDVASARAAAEATVPNLGAIMAMPIEATFHFFRALTLARSIESAEASELEAWHTTLNADVEKLARWAAASPDTFEAKYRIALGESLRIKGETLAALQAYDAGIDAAETSAFSNYAALACELAARCSMATKQPRAAAMHWALAHDHLNRWGAAALAGRVEAELLPLRAYLRSTTRVDQNSGTNFLTRTITSHEITARLLDVATVLKTAQAIASEIEMDRLLEQVMGIVLTNSGAQRAVLTMASRDEDESGTPKANPELSLVIVAIATVEQEAARTGLSIHLDATSREASASVIGFVANTRQTLISSNPHEDPKFVADPYLQTHKPRSILALPLLHQKKLTGVMVLENGIIQDAFTQERVDLLHLLCSQVAIALENARLYERIQHTSAALRSTNERLEADVAARTIEIQRRGDELDRINQQLNLELEERQRTEQARAELQDKIIRTQHERLAEMDTPLIPISDEVVVMPLIGMVDEERANRVLETALRGTQQANAKFLILDVTGLHRIDNSVADTLLRTARAVQLLGTTAIMTGVRADVAQTLINLDVDMSKIACLNRLQDGIAHANKRLRRR